MEYAAIFTEMFRSAQHDNEIQGNFVAKVLTHLNLLAYGRRGAQAALRRQHPSSKRTSGTDGLNIVVSGFSLHLFIISLQIV
jgi:hypothetical protein